MKSQIFYYLYNNYVLLKLNQNQTKLYYYYYLIHKITNSKNIKQLRKQMIPIEKRLEKAHPGYAYQLLDLQMAVQDEKLSPNPTITEITRLIQLYMIGVEVLQSISDGRFTYFHNKIHALMLKKHIVKKLHEASGQAQQVPKQSLIAVSKAELKDKKDEYQINFFFNQGQIDIKKVKEMLALAQTKKVQMQGKIKTDIKKQEDKLEQRIKQRKMRSQAGSVKKFKIGEQVPSPVTKRQTMKDPRMQYFNMTDGQFKDLLPKNKVVRTNSASLQKILFDRKYGQKTKQLGGSGQKNNLDDAI